MYQDDPNLDQRLTRFEARLDRFSLALHQWQQNQDNGQPFNPHDVDQRIRTLEETVDREAQALRRMHEEPLQQLQAQAAALKEICAAAANSVSGLDQAESRLTSLQADVQLHLIELTRTLQAFFADLRLGAPSTVSTQGAPATWPLERVVHLHDELRRAAANGREPVAGDAAPGSSPAGIWPHVVDGQGERPVGAVLDAGVAIEPGQPLPGNEAWWSRRRLWYLAGGVAAAGTGLRPHSD